MKNTLIQSNLRTRHILSIFAGNTIQITGIVLGTILFWISAQSISTSVRITAMIVGYLLIYFNSHSLAHFAVGQLAGIRFRHYSIGGSSHASSYPSILRGVFERLPFFAAHTNPVSMRAARPFAKAFMFTAGVTSAVVLCTIGALFAYRANTPGGSALLVFNIIWQVSSLIAEMQSSGDLGKAFNAIKEQTAVQSS
jgi:hypothetical protein